MPTCTTVTIASAAELIFRKVLATNLFNYRWFLVELLAILTFIVCGIMTMINSEDIGNRIPWSYLPLRTFVFTAILDAVHSNFLTVSIGVLPGSLSVLIPQTIVPLTLMIAFCSHSEQSCQGYTFLASTIIFVGIFLSFVPTLIQFEPCYADGKSEAEFSSNVGLLLMSCIPAAISTVYKQVSLAEHPVDITVMNMMTSGFQIIINLIIGPVSLQLQYMHATNSGPNANTGAAGWGFSGIYPSVSDASSGYGDMGSSGVSADTGTERTSLHSLSNSTMNSLGYIFSSLSAAVDDSSGGITDSMGTGAGDIGISAFEVSASGYDAVPNKGVWTNLGEGFLCLMGGNSEYGDMCAELEGMFVATYVHLLFYRGMSLCTYLPMKAYT